MVRTILILTLTTLAACGRCGRLDDLPSADVLWIGDSLLAWNEGRCRSVPAETALVRQTDYVNEAVNGAQMLGGSASILEQGPDDERFSVVVIDGGANDLNRRCSCSPCDDTLDDLLTEPAGPDDRFEGAFVDVTTRWRDTGARVLLLGYHPVKDRAWYGFADCFDTVTELDRRVEAYAAATDGVDFFDTGDVITPDVRGAYAADGVHYAPKAAELLAGPLARRIDALTDD